MPQFDPRTWKLEHLRLAITAAGVTLWSWNVDTDALKMDDGAFELWGLPQQGTVTFEDLSVHIHPKDRDRVRAAFQATRGIVGAFEIDFRIMLGDQIRWISARGQGDDAEIQKRLMYGVFIDVTGRKQAEEANELLAGEMSHRVKNLLAIASGLTAITSRSTRSTTDMARELTQRLMSLGRAHDLLRPVPGQQGQSALLGDLLTILLAPYEETAAFSGRIRVSVPRMAVSERAMTILAMVLHELATNSLKYGALSVPTGLLDVASAPPEEDTVIVWTERGGPAVTKPEGPGGYGSKLMVSSLAQIGGTIERTWDKAGIVVTIRFAKGSLSA